MRPVMHYIDPRRSLAAAIGWLSFALSIGLVLVASVWVGDIVRSNLLDMSGRQLDRAADDIADELNLEFALRLQSVRALAAMLGSELRDDNAGAVRRILQDLQQASPEFESIAVANTKGRILASTQAELEGSNAVDRPWFSLARNPPGADIVHVVPMAGTSPAREADGAPRYGYTIELRASIVDSKADVIGVIGIRLSQSWLLEVAANLAQRLREEAGTEALLLAQDGTVLIGAASGEKSRVDDTLTASDSMRFKAGINSPWTGEEGPAHIERLADGRRFLVASVIPNASDPLHVLGWRVVVLKPLPLATHRATILQSRISTVLLGLGLLAGLIAVFLARRVTRDLEAIAHSADDVRAGIKQQIAVPRGHNEAARLGRALQGLLTSLQHERSALQVLNAELDQRVMERTREVERLAEQSRYAAVVRERIALARDLHDTLAHSMMAMLSEIRLLKRLAATNPGQVTEELARAEEAAHQGLKEARAAITHLRSNSVRDLGLAGALADSIKSFVERTGIAVEFLSNAQPGAFADDQAQTLFRIAEEALRNIERHAGATQVSISLRQDPDGPGLALTLSDNGSGFDAQAAHPGHYGLVGLQEQAQLIGGVLTIRSNGREGTTITVTLPAGLNS